MLKIRTLFDFSKYICPYTLIIFWCHLFVNLLQIREAEYLEECLIILPDSNKNFIYLLSKMIVFASKSVVINRKVNKYKSSKFHLNL